MANDNGSTNTYEEARKQRVLENKRKFEDMGILNISKGLTNLTKSEKKTKERQIRPKAYEAYMVEPRRSSRARNPATSYHDDIDVELPRTRKRSNFSSSWTSYLARPLEEVKTASYEQRAQTLKSAEKLESNLQSGNPSFVKSMVRSHVYSCFWLGLPTWFCKDHLPSSNADIVLENEQGGEYEAVYISKRTGLSGGWRAFALEHKLDDGDALVFELIEPTRFKVYIVKAFELSSQDDVIMDASEEEDNDAEDIKEAGEGDKKTNESQSKDSTKAQKQKPTRALARCQKTQERSQDDVMDASEEEVDDAEDIKVEGKGDKKRNESQSKDSTKAQKHRPARASARLQRTQGRSQDDVMDASEEEVFDAEDIKVEGRGDKKKNESQSKDSTKAQKEKPTRASARLQRTQGK